MWDDGRTDGTSFSNEDVKEAYEERGEEQVPFGIHGTSIEVDWDSCVVTGSCMSICPVQFPQWFRIEQDVPIADCLDIIFEVTGLTEMNERLDYTDKSQPIREHDYTVCITCQEICPEGAILIESANQE